ncbi:hypothetical protein [Piscinibacter sp.]|jgi:hypothetical protein|uniref:hypothetical protein n=1 Tax=Piscinibacter sp. TaxID=1903157 RepID=UPI00355A8717
MSSKGEWRTAWQGQDIVIFRDDIEVDRVSASQIQRVVFVYGGSGESAGDLLHAVVETSDDFLIFPADTGFAGRINFERVDYWADRACVYWVHQSQAPLPLRLRRGRWWLRMSGPPFTRLPRAECATLLERWPVEGPQTWEQRKWQRIERSRPFAAPDDAGHRVRP